MSPTLGDSFPENLKEDFTSRNLKVGSVLKCRVDDTNPPKYKRFIVVGISFDKIALGAVYINSEINENVHYTDELKALQILFESNGRDYLDHDSYIDCSKIYPKKLEQIKDVVKNDINCYLGDLSEVDFKSIRSVVYLPTAIATVSPFASIE